VTTRGKVNSSDLTLELGMGESFTFDKSINYQKCCHEMG
jgi:hypothetical protein